MIIDNISPVVHIIFSTLDQYPGDILILSHDRFEIPTIVSNNHSEVIDMWDPVHPQIAKKNSNI